MHRRTVALGFSALFLVTSLATALVLLGPPRVALTDSAGDVDRVTLYQNGLAFIELTRSFQSEGGESLVAIPLPLAARLDSLKLEGDGVVLKEIRGPSSDDRSLRPGDALIVHAEDAKEFRGTYVGQQDGSLVLSTGAGTILVDSGHVTAIELTGRALPNAAPGTTEAIARVTAPAGAQSVRVSYLAQGPGWTPSYELDAGTGQIAFHATLVGLDDWDNVSLDLVSGAPHVVLQPIPYPAPTQPLRYESAVADAAKMSDDVGPSTPLGELHRYHHSAPLSVSRGESVRLLVEEGPAEIVSHRLDALASTGWGGHAGSRQDVTVLERLELRNTLPEPFPPGTVLAYRNGTWIGEDLLPATPKGERANLTLATSEDVVAKLVLESYNSTGARDTFAYAFSVTNRKDSPADVRAILAYPTHRTIGPTFDPAPDTTTGGEATWNVRLDPGETATFRISYEVDHTSAG